MANELVPKPANELAEFAAEYLAEEGFGLDSFPKYTVGQGSPKVGKVGHFNLQDGTAIETLSAVSFLMKLSSRVLFHGRNIRNKNARCASDDGINPAVERLERGPVNSIENGGCRSCPAAVWSADGTDADIFNSDFKDLLAKDIGYPQFDPKKPLCTYTENLILVGPDDKPFIIQVAKHNLKVVEQLQMMLKTMALKMRAPGWALQFDLSLIPMKGEGNRHLIVFSQSKDWKTISGTQAKDRKFIVDLVKRSGAQVVAAKHAAQDAAYIREAREAPPDFVVPPWGDGQPAVEDPDLPF